MKAKLKKITQSKFARNVAIVASGTAGAQALNFLFAPVVTRLYGPEAFGLLGVFTALVAILAPVAALTYPIAIVLPKQDRDAQGLAWVSFCIALAMSILVAVVIAVGGGRLLDLVGAESIASYSMLIPFAMLFAVFNQIAQQWLIRKKLFKITAKVAVLQALIINSAKTGFGFLNPIALILISITTVATLFHAILLWAGVRLSQRGAHKIVQPAAEVADQFSFSYFKKLAKKYYDFPLYRGPQVLINAASASLPILMLASFVGPAAAGFYTIAITVLAMPSSLIGSSVVAVFYTRFK
jgi:O-antigen/teichoic acid export membrane protein